MTDKEAMKLALDALEANYLLVNGTETHGGLEQCLDGYYSSCFDTDPINKQTEEAIATLKARLADPMRAVQRLGQEIEPDDIASILACRDMLDAQPVPEFDRVIWPERTWVGLTDEEKLELYRQFEDRLESDDWEYEKGIEAKLKQKNGFAEEKNAICSPFMISELWRLQK